jgi:hypothetical protein
MIGRQLGNSAMKTIVKTIAVSILAFAIVATSVIGTAMVLNLQSQPAAAAEPCIGLGCWPPDPPVKHRPLSARPSRRFGRFSTRAG